VAPPAGGLDLRWLAQPLIDDGVVGWGPAEGLLGAVLLVPSSRHAAWHMVVICVVKAQAWAAQGGWMCGGALRCESRWWLYEAGACAAELLAGLRSDVVGQPDC
jgi:hypothetical protein